MSFKNFNSSIPPIVPELRNILPQSLQMPQNHLQSQYFSKMTFFQ